MIKANASQIDITPDCEVLLAGTAELRKTAKVQSRLYATALVVDDGNLRLVLISLDLLFLNDALCTELRKRVAQAAGTIPDCVMICCTHTHNGPSMFPLLPQVSPDQAVVDEIKDKIVEGTRRAASQLREATMYSARETVARSFNRRTTIEAGKVWMGADANDPPITGAEGPEDQELLCVWFEDVNDKPIAVLVNYAAHPTHWLWELVFSSDFPGEIRKTIQNDLSNDIPVLYLQGCCGDTATKDFARFQYASDFDLQEYCAETGREIGEKVLSAMRNRASSQHNITLSCEKQIIEAPARHCGSEDMPLDEAREFMADQAEEVPSAYHGYDPAMWKRYWAESVAELEGAEPLRETYPLEISVYRIGDVVVVTNPAEMFVEYQLQVKNQSPFSQTMVVELANGYCGYIPTDIANRNGGYETRLALSSFLAPDAGSMWVMAAADMLNKLALETGNER